MFGFIRSEIFLNLLEELGLSKAGDVVHCCHKDRDIDEFLLCNKPDVKKTIHFRVLLRISFWVFQFYLELQFVFLFLRVHVSLVRFSYASHIVFCWPVLCLKCNMTWLLKTVIKYWISLRNPFSNCFSGMVTVSGKKRRRN